jgi:hypothetical protein
MITAHQAVARKRSDILENQAADSTTMLAELMLAVGAGSAYSVSTRDTPESEASMRLSTTSVTGGVEEFLVVDTTPAASPTTMATTQMVVSRESVEGAYVLGTALAWQLTQRIDNGMLPLTEGDVAKVCLAGPPCQRMGGSGVSQSETVAQAGNTVSGFRWKPGIWPVD